MRMRASTPAAPQLQGRLVAVAAVGDEDEVVGRTRSNAADPVNPVRYRMLTRRVTKQRVAPGLVQLLAQAGDAGGHVHRSQ